MIVVNWINLTRLKDSYVLAVVVVTKCKRFSEDYLATASAKSADDFTAASIAINHEKALEALES
jgi:hypothetical protein